jgi:hypothetical protein
MRLQRIMIFPLVVGLLSLIATSTTAFTSRVLSKQVVVVTQNRRSLLIPKMCICINCARVTDCTAYHFVESKHNQPHMTENPSFEPSNGSPTIHVNIRTVKNEDRQREIERMYNEHESETERAQQTQNEADGPLVGETTYHVGSSTTYEYDVVKCADYVEDHGCWIRNMPEEIKKSNPQFVPS